MTIISSHYLINANISLISFQKYLTDAIEVVLGMNITIIKLTSRISGLTIS